jgi:2,4-dienoyl-CoA reductase-like NADH-dependent reductase (Old Yellow Enzyme family)
VIGPSDEPYSDRLPTPKAMTLGQIEDVKRAFVASVKRAVAAGFDVIEIHNAHGYLLSSFVSPASNHRTDQYGGSFENRIRLTLEIVDLTRKEIPDRMPLFLRITATDWLEQESGLDSWKSEDTVRLAEILAEKGVDLLDVSSGGNHQKQKIDTKAHGGAYQAVCKPP